MNRCCVLQDRQAEERPDPETKRAAAALKQERILQTQDLLAHMPKVSALCAHR